MKIETIIKRFIKILFKNEWIYSFELIHSYGLVSGITNLSMLLLNRHKVFFYLDHPSFLFYFWIYQEVVFSYLTNACNFKMT